MQKNPGTLILALGLLLAWPGPLGAAKKGKNMDAAKIYSFSMKDIDGKATSLGRYKGQVLLIVNVASKCGNTPQYADLQKVFEKYHPQGFEVLGFPANDFGRQEPGSDAEIKEFCDSKYHVTFPMFSKIVVKGPDKDPLYAYLTEATDFKGEIGWNFAKFLVDRRGRVVARFDPKTRADSAEAIGAIEKALAEPGTPGSKN